MKTFCCENMEQVIKEKNTLPKNVFEVLPDGNISFKQEGILSPLVKYCPFCGTNLKEQPKTEEIKKI